MASERCNYVLTESAEADIDEEEKNIVVLRVVYNRRDQDKILKTI
jgi:hypothetical protein